MVEHTTEDCSCEGKKCSVCEQDKCHSLFDVRREQGGKYVYLRACCKDCRKAQQKERWHRDANDINERRRSRRPERAEIINAQLRASYKKHGKARQERRRMRMAQDSEYAERQRAVSRRARARRRDATNAKMRTPAYRAKARVYDQNRYRKDDSRRLWHQSYRENNPHLFRSYYRVSAHKKRAKKAKTGGFFTNQEWVELKAACNYTCLSCGKKEPEITLVVDHIIPLSKGGSSYISNIQPLCAACNARKGRKIIDYRRSHYE